MQQLADDEDEVSDHAFADCEPPRAELTGPPLGKIEDAPLFPWALKPLARILRAAPAVDLPHQRVPSPGSAQSA